MGCDIHIWAERKTADAFEAISGVKFTESHQPFDWQDYGMYAFLAGVRNYSDIPPISEPRGFPADASSETRKCFEEWGVDAHSASWLLIEELSAFNFDRSVEDRRISVQRAPNWIDGGGTAEPGGGKMTTYREFLGEHFFSDLAKLTEVGADRIVFWFDN